MVPEIRRGKEGGGGRYLSILRLELDVHTDDRLSSGCVVPRCPLRRSRSLCTSETRRSCVRPIGLNYTVWCSLELNMHVRDWYLWGQKWNKITISCKKYWQYWIYFLQKVPWRQHSAWSCHYVSVALSPTTDDTHFKNESRLVKK